MTHTFSTAGRHSLHRRRSQRGVRSGQAARPRLECLEDRVLLADGFAFQPGYQTVEQLHQRLDQINAAFPTLTEVVDYDAGTGSFCKTQGGCVLGFANPDLVVPGFDLKALRITNEAVPGNKPEFLLMANLHAREIVTPELAIRFIDDLTRGYGTDADATWLVDHHEIWVIPTANPDGHKLAELGIPQRKNLNFTAAAVACDPATVEPSAGNQPGVDLNRNHSFAWGAGQGGVSLDPCEQQFIGTAPASEPEVARLEQLLSTQVFENRLRGDGSNSPANINVPASVDTDGVFVTMHSSGDLVVRPWAHVMADAPNEAGLKKIADKLAALHDVTTTIPTPGTPRGYKSCRPPDTGCLFENVSITLGGDSAEFAYGRFGVPAFTFEIGSRFDPAFSQVDWLYAENRASLFYAAKLARDPYLTIEGPDSAAVAAVRQGDRLQVSAVVQSFLGFDVAAAQFFLDTPPWQNNAQPVAMVAADGGFDEPHERVQGTLDVTGLGPGPHIVFVRASDERGFFGPVTAAFFPVTVALTGDVTPVELSSSVGGSNFSVPTLELASAGEAITLAGNPLVGPVDLVAAGRVIGRLAFSEHIDGQPYSTTGRFYLAPSVASDLAVDSRPDEPGFQGVIKVSFTADVNGAPTAGVATVHVNPGFSTLPLGAFPVLAGEAARTQVQLEQRLAFLGFPDHQASLPKPDGVPDEFTQQSLRLFQAVVDPTGTLLPVGNASQPNAPVATGTLDNDTLAWLNSADAPRWLELVDPDPNPCVATASCNLSHHNNPNGVFDYLPGGNRTGSTPQPERFGASWLHDTIIEAAQKEQERSPNAGVLINGLSNDDGVSSIAFRNPLSDPGRFHQAGLEVDFHTQAITDIPQFVVDLRDAGLKHGGIRLAEVVHPSATTVAQINAALGVNLATTQGSHTNVLHVGFAAAASPPLPPVVPPQPGRCARHARTTRNAAAARGPVAESRAGHDCGRPGHWTSRPEHHRAADHAVPRRQPRPHVGRLGRGAQQPKRD